jgi:hypothetical protein
MLKKLRALKEIGELQAKARGNSLENVIAQQIVGIDIDPIPSLIGKVFRLEKVEKVTKEEKQTAKKILKEKYGIDVKKEDNDFFSKEGTKRKTRATKPLQDVKKVIETMAESVTNIRKTTEQIRDQNDQILNILNARMMEKVDQIAGISPMSPVYTPPLPVGTEKSAGGIIVPRDVNKKIAQEVVKETEPKKEPKEKQTAVKEKIFKETDTIFEKTKTLLGIIYPELKDVFQKKNEEKTSETDVSNTTNNSNSTSNVSNTTNNSNSTSLSQPIFNTNNESLQPAMESIAEKKPLQSQIEPDELKILLKEALKEALDQLKTENPELFKSDGGGLDAGLLNMLPVPGGGGGRKRRGKRKVPGGAAKAAGKGLFNSAKKKLPFGIGAVMALSLVASRAQAGDFSGAAMEMGSGLASIVPGIGTAASLGIDAALAAKDAGAFDGSTIPPKPATELSSMVPANTGAEIIEMNRRIQTGEVAIRSTPQNAQVVQRIVNNNVLPPPKSKEKINVGNNENTFNRLIEQDFDHPSTYSSFNMG